MVPQYSMVMFCPDMEEEVITEVSHYLSKGIKVFLFTMDSFQPFEKRPMWQKAIEIKLLEAYEIPYRQEWVGAPVAFYDGRIDDPQLWRYLCAKSSFNEEQYQIEHHDSNIHLMVKAGAGTGKTTALINRLLFLKHMDPQFSFQQVALITFTNAAALHMRQRLVDRLYAYFHLTGDGRYLNWLEEVYQLQISTIHSFAQKILELSGQFGRTMGNEIRTFEAEKKRLIEEAIDSFARQYPEKYQPFRFKPHYQLVEAALQMYEGLQNRALSTEKMADLDFGQQEDDHAFFFSYLIKTLDRELEQIKEKNKEIEVNDLIRRLNRVDALHLQEKFPFRYVMVDEFQDTDPVQVSFLLKLVQETDCRLFAVGDVKQSIYRFRGADYTAFQQLQEGLTQMGQPYHSIALVKNYRSTPLLLQQLNELFSKWPKLIPTFTFEEDDRLVPMTEAQEKDEGLVTLPLDKTNLKYLLSRLQGEETAILVRSNQDVQHMIDQIESLGFFCEGIRTGKFYRSLPVREFYQMLLCLIHPESSLYQYARHLSSYGANTLSVQEVIDTFSPQKDHLADLLKRQPDLPQWITYAQRAKEEPIFPLLQEIVEHINPAQVFAQRSYAKMRRAHPEQDRAIQLKEVKVRAKDYQNNLDYLFYLLQKHFTDQVVTLAGIERFLRIKMTTDRVETGVLPDEEQISHRFRVMTVHQAKGLEFNHVILPITEHSFDQHGKPDIFVTHKDDQLLVGYKLFIDLNAYENVYYQTFRKKENLEQYGEEARLLYVALTRAKRSVFAHIHGKKRGKVTSWHHLLQEKDGEHVQSGNLLQPTSFL